MSHASSLEKAKQGLKKARQFKKDNERKERILRAELGEKEYSEMVNRRYEKTLKDEVITAIWDYERRQYPPAKYDYFKEILNERLREIKEPKNCEELQEKNKIEGILNGFRN